VKFLADNWQLVFGGLGTGVVAAVVGTWAKSYFDRKSNNAGTKAKTGTSQQIRSGSSSTNVQAGRDANVGGQRK
jgi:hypothetical protein